MKYTWKDAAVDLLIILVTAALVLWFLSLMFL